MMRANLPVLQSALFLFVCLFGLDGTAFSQNVPGTGALAFEPAVINTIAGGFGSPAFTWLNGPAASSGNVGGPVAVDGAGNAYLASAGTVFKVSALTGAIATVAGNGSVWSYSGDGGPATSATFGAISSIAADSAGNIYIGDWGNGLIRKVTVSTGIITTVAGRIPNNSTNYTGDWGDGGPATNAIFWHITGVAVDSQDNLYISDGGDPVIRMVNAATGVITTIAGTRTIYGNSGDGGPATSAGIKSALAVAVDNQGNVYIPQGCYIRKVTAATGIISTIAGVSSGGYNGTCGYYGDGGPAVTALISSTANLVTDADGNVYFAQNSAIREIDASTGNIDTLEHGDPGSLGGFLAIDDSNNIYVSGGYLYKIEASTGYVANIAGAFNINNGLAAGAALSSPAGLAADSAGNVYIADQGSSQVYKINAASRVISTISLTGSVNTPLQVATDLSGNLFVQADNSFIYEMDASNETISYPDINSLLCNPTGIGTDSLGNLYVADSCTAQIYKYNPSSGSTAVIVGTGNRSYNGDSGAATSADLYDPEMIALDVHDNLYIMDACKVRVVYASGSIPNVPSPIAGNIYTVAGTGTCGYSGDNASALGAQLGYGMSIAIDKAGNVYAADPSSARVREIMASTGFIKTAAGNGSASYSGDGGPATSAGLSYPVAVAADPSGNLYIADNSVVREVGPQGVLTFGSQSTGTTSTAQGVTVTNRGNAALSFSAPATAGSFSIVSGNTCGVNILPVGASCTLYIQFSPTVAGNSNGTVTLYDNGMTNAQAVTLMGLGTQSQSQGIFDSGSVTLTVNGPAGSLPVSVPYGAQSTSASIAGLLAAGFAAIPNSPVIVAQNTTGSGLLITAIQPGSGSDYSYALTTTSNDASDFGSGGSFGASQTSGTLVGGSAPVTIPGTVYKYSITQPNGSSGYATNSNLQAYTDSVMGSWSYSYDGVNRLVGGVVSPAVNENSAYCWSYDSFGNRTNQSGSNQQFQTTGTNTSPCQPASGAYVTVNAPSYNNQNQITSSMPGTGIAPGYDQAGGMISDGINSYTYDGDGRICAVATASISGGVAITEYLYNASGDRVAKGAIQLVNGQVSCDITQNNFTLTNQYILGPNSEQMTELAAASVSSANSSGWVHTNVYVGGGLSTTYLNDGSGPHFRLTDWLGTLRAQTNYAGALEETCKSLPFGDAPPCDRVTEQFFTGKERDAESGLDYFGARYYESIMGRFMSPDWSVKEEPVPYAKLDNPQSLNLYSYVLNNPLSNVDTDGHACGGLYFNSGSGFCQRATEYGKIDAMSGVQSQTRFFAAANAVSQALADVATPVSGLLVSGKTANFLEGVGQNLEKLNQTEAAAIQNGSLSGPNLDQTLVHNEQSSVQSQLDNLQQSDPSGYTKAIGEINGSLNSMVTQGLEQLRGTDRAYAGVLAGVRKDLGRNIDFSKQGDREAIGNALIKHIRQTGGCDVNGKKQAGC